MKQSKQHHFYDEDRGINVMRVHDGRGNIYVFNTPPGLVTDALEVLKKGELIATKMKGACCKRIDNSVDPNSSHYNLAVPLEASTLSGDLFSSLLQDSLARAPKPGSETIYAPPTAAAATSVQGRKGLRFEQRDDGFYYQDNPITKKASGCHYVQCKMTCAVCREAIPVEASVAFRDGRPWSIGTYKPLVRDSAAPSQGSRHWCHTTCCGSAAITVPEPKAPLAEPRGKFTIKGGHYYYKGQQLQKTDTGAFVLYDRGCLYCTTPIPVRVEIDFKDDHPYVVSERALDDGASRAGSETSAWAHHACAQEKKNTMKAISHDMVSSQARPQAGESPVFTIPTAIPATEKTADPGSLPATYRKAIKRLKVLAMDRTAISDEMYRGAAFALFTAMEDDDAECR